MPKFRKRPVEVEAVRHTCSFEVATLEGTMVGEAGDWLITGVEGEQYPCKDKIFRQTYEPVDDEARAMWDGEPAPSDEATALRALVAAHPELKDVFTDVLRERFPDLYQKYADILTGAKAADDVNGTGDA